MTSTRSTRWRRAGFAGATALVLALTARTDAAPWQIVQDDPQPLAERGLEETAAVDPQAVDVMRRTVETLAAAEQFTVHAQIWNDHVLDEGATVQYESRADMFVRRPDRLKVALHGQLEDRELWYDGSTVHAQVGDFYTTLAGGATIDATLDMLLERFEVRFPLQTLARANLASGGIGDLQRAVYLGVHTANGVPCHHVWWSEADVDVEVWIDAGETPLPRRIVIDYKTLPSQPRYQASLHGWDLSTKLADDEFAFSPPAGVEEIDIVDPKTFRPNGEEPR